MLGLVKTREMLRGRMRQFYLFVGILIIVVLLCLPWTTKSQAEIQEQHDVSKVDVSNGDEPYRHPKNILNVPKSAVRTEDTVQEEADKEEPEDMCPINLGDNYITLQDGIIKVDMASLQAEGWEKLDCRYQPFVRKMDHDVSFNPKAVIQNFGKKGEISFPVKHEFVKVECRLVSANMTRQTIYRLFSQIIRDAGLVKQKVKVGGTLGVNVFLLCVGSMSQNRFKMRLPQTYRFLTQELRAREFPRYHMVGTTTEAMIAATTGQRAAELAADLEKQHMGWYKDMYPWVWKVYKEAGYVTLLADEMPSVWGHTKGAFRNQPTDHYLRPLFIQATKTFGTSSCVGSTPAYQATLDYTRDFTKKYSDYLMFALTSIHNTSRTQRSTHDFAQIDSDIYSLLKFWNSELLLQKSLLVVFSDIADVATDEGEGGTENGSMLPFMSIALPSSIEHRYSNTVSSLKVNQNRSTSPFDLHQTLLEVLDYRPRRRSLYTRDNSLFHEIPADRSCRQAGIPKEHCTGSYDIHPEI